VRGTFLPNLKFPLPVAGLAVAASDVVSNSIWSRDRKEAIILGLCSVQVLYRWNWKDVSVVVICCGLTVIVRTS